MFLSSPFRFPLWMVLCLGILPNPGWARGVRLTEIMYHPAGTNRFSEWFEVQNTDATPVDLSGWRVTRGVAFTFPLGTVLEAAGFLVVAADAATFATEHPGVTNVVSGWQGMLSHDGEELRIEDRLGGMVDRVGYAPEGDWAQRRLGAEDSLKRRGWEWFAGHAGLGKSLELVQSGLPGEFGQNWGSSLPDGGTPGRSNSIALANTAPLILEVSHLPVVPRSTELVAVRARLLDEQPSGLSASLHWRLDGAAAFNASPMFDDGFHGDGLAGDGWYGAVLEPQAHGTIVEFHITARDADGLVRTYPNVEPSGGARTANPAYQVDDTVDAGDQPLFRLIMTRAEQEYLATEIWGGAPASDASVNGTFISTDGVLDGGSTTQLRYGCAFRNRGHGSRTAVPHNFHVGFPKDRTWKGRFGINLNTHYTHSQHLGGAVFRRWGVPMADSRPVRVRVNGAQLAKPGQEQFGSYAANEVIDGRLVETQFPLDPGGNLYRGVRDMIPGIDSEADLAWHGDSYTSYTNAYAKENNGAANDWSDLLRLIDVLNHTPDATYVETVRQVVDVEAWMRYFAINTLLDNQENSLGNGEGDDFALYRGLLNPRFVLMAYDMDAVMGRGLRDTTYGDGLWRMARLPVIDRFIKHPEFVPLYYRHLRDLAAAAFAPPAMDPFLDSLLGGYVDAVTLRNLKAFNASHRAHVLDRVPLALSVSHDLPLSGGYPRTTAGTVHLSGHAPAVETRRVRVNGVEAQWTAWQAAWTNAAVVLQPGLNRVCVQAFGEGDVELERRTLDIWQDDGSVSTAGGTLTSDTVWTAAGGPYHVTANLTVGAGSTLTVEPGSTVYLGSGVDLVVANGGRLLAEGTEVAPIRFGVMPGTSASWGGLTLHGGPGSPETRIAHAHFEGNGTTCIEVAGGTLLLDHATFGTTSHPYVSLDDSSFLIRHCHFPTTTAAFEPMHGTGGIKAGGRGIVRDCYFGSSTGYNDIVDFTGGNRPGQPLLQFYNNVFVGSTDDILDLDGTDGWIEGNIFLHVHRNGAPDSSAAISGGNSGGQTSELTIVRNLFFDCDNAVTAKQGNFYTLLHNTIVRTTRAGGEDFGSGVVNVRDTTPEVTSFGRGVYLEGNIVVDTEALVRNHDTQQTTVTWVNNSIPVSWDGPGSGNSLADPLLCHLPTVGEASFATWREAQVMWTWFALQDGSPARGRGPVGRDRGAVVPAGAPISGEPAAMTAATEARLEVGWNRTGSGIPVAGYPEGAGFTHYRWRLDDGAWSDETSISSPIALTGLAAGTHAVQVVGKNDAGLYQDDPALGSNAVVTLSRSWTIDPAHVTPPELPSVWIHEILAANRGYPTALGATPDLVELHNFGTSPVDLSGMGLSDSADQPHRYTFPPGTVLAAGGYLVVRAEVPLAPDPLATGFGLRQGGDELLLHHSLAGGGRLLDRVRFGLQVPDLALGRLASDVWGPCLPTPGAENRPVRTGDPAGLRINEWLADARFVAAEDFVELHNPDPLPVALGGLHLSDSAGARSRHAIAPLSFIAGRGHAVFLADGQPGLGAEHLGFKLSPDVGVLLLSAPDLTLLDAVAYGSQRTDVSEGRSPDGSGAIVPFVRPTPGGGNPGSGAQDCTVVTRTVELLPAGSTWMYQQTENLDGSGWQEPAYQDSGWPSGPALLGVENSTLPTPGRQTTLTLGRITYYFRTRFVVETNLAGFDLNLRMVTDDGALLYLNGVGIWTNGLATGTPGYATLASRNVGTARTEFLTLPATLLVPGTNVLAAEVHQVSAGSSDIVWGLAVDATRSITNCAPSGVTRLVLNEVLAASRTSLDPEGAPSDFVEIRNLGVDPVDLTGLGLTDDASIPTKWTFPSGTTLAPGGAQVVWCNGGRPASATHTGFGLEQRGGAVFLFSAAAGGGGLLDAIQYGLQTPDFSIARLPDGAGSWGLAVPTPGATNQATLLSSESALSFNEWMADPVTGDDWLELHNRAAQPVALGGLLLTDDLADPGRSPIAPLSFVGAGVNAFVQFIADGNTDAGANHLGFSLRKSGEALGVFSATGVLLDGLSFGAQQPGVSEGRFPDGAAARRFFTVAPSPGRPNVADPGASDSDGDGMDDAWELSHFGTLGRDGTGDFDLDLMSDREEFVAGTHPGVAADRLGFLSVSGGGPTTLQFRGVRGRSYTVRFRDSLVAGAWVRLMDVELRPADGVVTVVDPDSAGGQRFYQLVTPALVGQ